MIQVNRCLNARVSIKYCTSCFDGCPRNAIELTDSGEIHLKPETCCECALCVSDCPTETFTHRNFDPVELIASVTTLINENAELHLYCQAGKAEQADANDLHIPCHGLLDDRLLIGLRHAGVNRLNIHGLEMCGSCPAQEGARRLVQTFEKTPPTLRDHFPSLHDISTGEALSIATSVKKVADTKKTQKPMDRRKFLDSAIKGVVNAVTLTALNGLPTSVFQRQGNRNDSILPGASECSIKHLPQRHKLALLNLQNGDISIADTGDKNAWFYEVHGHSACDVCGICSLICPTGALAIEDGGKSIKLNHRSASCIGCDLCSDFCPQEALQLLVAHDDTNILNESSRLLFEYKKIGCETCGSSFVGDDDHTNLCRSCENEKAVREQWLGDTNSLNLKGK